MTNPFQRPIGSIARRMILCSFAVWVCYGLYEGIALSSEYRRTVPPGSTIAEIQDTMLPRGFACSHTGDKWGSDDVFCLKKERFGPGLTNDYCRALVAIAPSLYGLLPKDANGGSTFKRVEVVFGLEDGRARDVRADIALTPH